MPFVDTNRNELRSIELGQVPVRAATFQLRERIGYYAPSSDGVPPDEAITWAHAHERSERPSRGNRTDLASVPAIFWGLIASYGRQTAAAVIHDSECWRVRSLPDGTAFRERVGIDRMFRSGLRESGVSPFRAWVMWMFSSIERYQKFAKGRFVLLVAAMAVGIGLVVSASIALLVGVPPWGALLIAIVPFALSLVAGRDWLVLVWASYAGALLLPVAVLQVAAYLPYLLVENTVWFFVDWLPHRRGSPVLGPFDVRTLRRL